MDSAGWKGDELAAKTGISAGLIRQWRTRESEISLEDIEKMSKKIERSVSAFMLPEPPIEAPVAGFRLGPGSAAEPPSRKLCAAVKLAREIQYNARELLEESPGDAHIPAGNATAMHTDDPERAAAGEAALVGLPNGTDGGSIDAPDRYNKAKSLYASLRDAVESRGVFVAQAGFPAEEAKGFAITGSGPPVILINSNDVVESRIFTLFHEYAHVMLDGGSLCQPSPETIEAPDLGSGREIEGWCDSFAASILMPKREFLASLGYAEGGTVGGTLTALSQKFLLSKRTVLVRAIGLLGGRDRGAYLDHYERLGPPPPPAAGAGGRRSPPEVACLNRLGRRYARLVVDLEEAGRITESDMGMYLDLKPKHFDTLRAKVWDG